MSEEMNMPAINIAETKPIICPKCGCQVFDQGVLLRRISSVLTGNGQPGLVPITVFQCVNCHEVPEDFLPVELKGMVDEINAREIPTESEEHGSKIIPFQPSY